MFSVLFLKLYIVVLVTMRNADESFRTVIA